jgi:hypothetical protein
VPASRVNETQFVQSTQSTQANLNLVPATRTTTNSTQTTSGTQSSQSSSSGQTTTTVTSQSQSSGLSSGSIDLTGFTAFTDTTSPYYSYVKDGTRYVEGVFQQQGVAPNLIIYKSIMYKVEASGMLTIVFIVEVKGVSYSFRYQGQVVRNATTTTTAPQTQSSSSSSQGQPSQIPSSVSMTQNNLRPSQTIQITQTTQTTQTTQPSSQPISQPSSTVSINSQPTSSQLAITSEDSVSYQGGSWSKVSTIIRGQSYVTLYLDMLTKTTTTYQVSNLYGLYTNAMIPYSLLFVYWYGSQYYVISTSPTEIQQKLA